MWALTGVTSAKMGRFNFRFAAAIAAILVVLTVAILAMLMNGHKNETPPATGNDSTSDQNISDLQRTRIPSAEPTTAESPQTQSSSPTFEEPVTKSLPPKSSEVDAIIESSLKGKDPKVVDPAVCSTADTFYADPDARWLLALCFQFGFGVDRDPAKADVLLQYAVSQEEAEGASGVATSLGSKISSLTGSEDEFKLRDFPDFFPTLDDSTKKAIRAALLQYFQANNEAALYPLAMSYVPEVDENDKGPVKYDTDELGLLSKQVDDGDVTAMYKIYLHFMNQYNKGAALIWLRRAAEGGYPRAIHELAKVYSDKYTWVAHGIVQNFTKAKDLYRKLLQNHAS